jgi:hypothetical protein
MNLTEQETAVLDFYRRENQGVIESEARASRSIRSVRHGPGWSRRARSSSPRRAGTCRSGR